MPTTRMPLIRCTFTYMHTHAQHTHLHTHIHANTHTHNTRTHISVQAARLHSLKEVPPLRGAIRPEEEGRREQQQEQQKQEGPLGGTRCDRVCV